MVLNAGSLNRRIQVYRLNQGGLDEYGNANGTWTEFGGPIFANRRDVSDAERVMAGRWDNRLVTRFIIRATAFGRSIARSDRISNETITFEIDGIKEVPNTRGFLEITAMTDEIA